MKNDIEIFFNSIFLTEFCSFNIIAGLMLIQKWKKSYEFEYSIFKNFKIEFNS